MGRARATDTERAYWKKIADANAQLESDATPATSMDEVFERMEDIRRHLGSLATAGVHPDDDLAIAENVRIREFLLQRERRGT